MAPKPDDAQTSEAIPERSWERRVFICTLWWGTTLVLLFAFGVGLTDHGYNASWCLTPVVLLLILWRLFAFATRHTFGKGTPFRRPSRLLSVAACLSLTLAFAVCGRWLLDVPSFLRLRLARDEVTLMPSWEPPHGRECLEWIRWPDRLPPDSIHYSKGWAKRRPDWAFLGFDFAAYPFSSSNGQLGSPRVLLQVKTLHIPYWPVVIVFLLVPAIWLSVWLKEFRWHKSGVCPRCGYDLRASPDRCPECGTFKEGAEQ